MDVSVDGRGGVVDGEGFVMDADSRIGVVIGEAEVRQVAEEREDSGRFGGRWRGDGEPSGGGWEDENVGGEGGVIEDLAVEISDGVDRG